MYSNSLASFEVVTTFKSRPGSYSRGFEKTIGNVVGIILVTVVVIVEIIIIIVITVRNTIVTKYYS